MVWLVRLARLTRPDGWAPGRAGLLGPVLCGLLLALAPLDAAAATITVNDTGTAVNGADGTCTLIEAITAANTNTPSGGAANECQPASQMPPPPTSSCSRRARPTPCQPSTT